MSWAATWTVLGAVGTLTSAALPLLLDVPGLILLTGAALVGVVVVLATGRVVHGVGMFADRPCEWKDQVVRWVAVVTVVHWGWVTALTLRPDRWPWWIALLTTFAAIEYGFCRLHRFLLVTPPTPRLDPVTGSPLPAADDAPVAVFTAALRKARCDHATVIGWAPIGDPPFGVRFTVRVHLGDRRTTPRLSAEDAEPIAIALGEQRNTTLHSDWVQIEKQPGAGTYSVVVVTEDVMAKVRPYVDDPTPTTIRSAAVVGYRIDGTEHRMPLNQHGREVGRTRSGKSSLIHVKFAHITRCTDAVSWVCGAEKLYDLVAGWIEPYEGTDHPLPFGWIASGQADLLDMLIAGMNVARWRQRQPMHARRGFTTIVIELDEASFALRNRAVRGNYQGQSVTAAEAAAMLAQGGGSAGVWLQTASQRSTLDHAGDQGGDTYANLGYSAGFQSSDKDETGRLMGDYKLSPPRHQGEYWLTTEDGPVLLKAPYLQEVDPSKPRLHDGVSVSDVAWARRHVPRELDPGSAQAAGAPYARRHTRMDDSLLEYLTATEPVRTDGEPTGDAGRAGYEQAMAETDRMLAAVGLADESQEVVAIEGRRSRADRITDILRSADSPMAVPEILTALHSTGDQTATTQTVSNALTVLTGRGDEVLRSDRGRYTYRAMVNTGGDLTVNDLTT